MAEEKKPEAAPAAKAQPPAEKKAEPPAEKKAWGEPLARFDKWWTRVETRLCAAVLFTEIAGLCLWVALKGLSREFTNEGNKAGLILRLLLTAGAVGAVVNVVKRVRAARE